MLHEKGSLSLALKTGEAFDLGGRCVHIPPTGAREEVGMGWCRTHRGATFHRRFCSQRGMMKKSHRKRNLRSSLSHP